MNPAPDWWRTFFSGLFVEFWLKVPTDAQTEHEASFVQEALGVAPPARLLDVPCGGGRHSLALAQRGFVMTGVDISPGFLEAAKRETARLRLTGSVTWENREMNELPWSAAFDGACCLGNSFGYDTEAGNARFLQSVARALKPGAKFVLETSYVSEVILPTLQERSWYEFGGIHVLSKRSYDPALGRLAVEYSLIEAGQIETRSMSARIYSYREIAALLDQSGFEAHEAFGSFERGPFELRSPRLLIVATRSAR